MKDVSEEKIWNNRYLNYWNNVIFVDTSIFWMIGDKNNYIIVDNGFHFNKWSNNVQSGSEHCYYTYWLRDISD